MASPERSTSAALDARLASLEEEATRLRAELAALQEDMRWLVGEDEVVPGWLARGWVRASLLLATVGVVALVSVPYFLHLDASPARVAEPARDAPAVIRAATPERVPAPLRVRAARASEPASIRPADQVSGLAPERQAAAPAVHPQGP